MKRPARMKSAKTAPRVPSGALVAVAAAAGLLVGLRSIAALRGFDFIALVRVTSLPLERLGVEWSGRAVWPAELQRSALDGLLATVASLFLAAVAVATLNALILLAESAAGRRSEFAVRSAVGGTPLGLAAMLVAELRTLIAGGLALGLVAGMSAGAAARTTWPHALKPIGSEPMYDVLGGILLVLVIVTVAYGLGAWQTTRGGRMASELKSGVRATADSSAVFVRKVLTATHIAVAGTVMVAALILSGAFAQPLHSGADSDGTVVIESTSPSPGAWSRTLGALRAMPGLEAGTLSTPGALVGLGIRDIAIAECGRCSRGGLPAPLWNALANHHSVTSGFFDLAGMEVVEGRPFSIQDDASSQPVAIVNRTFARTSFESGKPIGKHVRIGADFEGWYEVIGVVDDASIPGLGSEATPREAVYLSALQRPPRTGRLLLRGNDESILAVEALLAGAGFESTSPIPLSTYRVNQGRALRWAYHVAALLGTMVLLLAAHGVYTAALQTSRRRTAELAVRRAVGAPSHRIVTFVLGERLQVTAWGLVGFLFFGTLTAAPLQGAAGMEVAGPMAYAGIAGLLVTIATLASIRAVREALAVEPARLLE